MIDSLPVLTADLISARRAALRCLGDGRKVSTDEEAARYVDERGFCPLMHLVGCELPSISEADVRVPWEGFDITDGAWRWKEVLPQERKCAYGKFLRQRGFFISWRLFPAFYRLYGRPSQGNDLTAKDTKGEEDGQGTPTYVALSAVKGIRVPSRDLQDYADGLLGRLEWLVLETVAERGPIDSRQLWRAVKRSFGANRGRFEQALGTLQAGFRIMVAGGDLEGWSLHRWDLVERQVPPGLLDQRPSPEEARVALLVQYVDNAVVCTVREIAGFFRWDLRLTQALVADELRRPDGRTQLGGRSAALVEVQVEGWKGKWLSVAV